MFDWGDYTNSGWLGPSNSGSTLRAYHKFTGIGSYHMKVIARYSYGVISEWSEPINVIVIKNRSSYSSFFMRFLEKFPNAFPILIYFLEGGKL